VTAGPKYTPYMSTPNPFVIGLSALDRRNWIEPDDDLDLFLSEKERLCDGNFEAIFQEVEGSDASQRECLDLLVDHLTDSHGDFYRRSGTIMEVAGRKVDLASGQPPLLIAGSLIQDDLVILSRRDTGWHVVAGYVAFPSSWSLREKIGLPMEGVHHHVPGFAAGTRNATMINRIFDNLQPYLPAMRMNWSIYPEGDLFWPPERGARMEGRPFTPASNFIRVERQVLRRLPETRDIVFSIRIYSDPIATLLALPDGAEIARTLAQRLEGLTPEQLAYKGMVSKKAALVSYLGSLGG
jgi:hypothetical protein